MKKLDYIRILALIIGISLACQLNAQDQQSLGTEEICKQALRLSPEEGILLLESHADDCRNSAQAEECQFKMNFTTAYLYQLAAKNSGDRQPVMLEKSKRYYLSALEHAPQNVAVLTNLVLVDQTLGNLNESQDLLTRLIEVDPQNKALYLTRKGDLLVGAKDYDQAIEFYKRAFFINPKNEALAWKIFNACNSFSDKQHAFDVLDNFSNRLFENGLYDLARSGYLNAINSALAFNDSKLANAACVQWAEALSEKNNLNGQYAGELPDLKTWPSKCNEEIQLVLSNSFENIGQLSWWTADDYRRHIVASVLFKMESVSLIEGKVKSAVQMLETALKIAPEFFAYDSPKLRHYYPVKMDIAIELSRLYNRYPDLDLDKSTYDSLIRDLFNEKAAHYLQNDLGAIQKSHTMLGLIFADRGVWTSDWFAGNAIFQLEHAIRFQKQIEESNPEKFKPMPSIYQLLAKGYEKTNRKELVPGTLVEAAAGYLDLDNLTMADSIINRVRNDETQPAELRQKLNELSLVAEMRLAVRNDSYNVGNADAKSLEKTISESELFRMKTTEDDQSFLNRQKFKILADLGAKFSEKNPNYQYPYFEIKALDYIDQEKALGNFQDVNRLNQIEEKFRNNLGKDSRIQINQSQGVKETGGQSKTWQLNTGSYQGEVEVNSDLFVAGKVYEDLTKDDKVEGLDQIQIRRGEVIIPSDLQEKETIDDRKIQRIKGVKNVRIATDVKEK